MVDVDDLKRLLPMPELLHKIGLGEYAKSSVCSPFRNENNPSWGIFKREAKWFFKDQATGDSGDEITLLARWKRLDERRNFLELVRLYGELAGVDLKGNSGGQSTAKHDARRANSFAWSPCVDTVGPADLQKLAAWRGYSPEFCAWLKTENVIGLYNGHWALPVHDDTGTVVACHYRVERPDDKPRWPYHPKNLVVRPLIFGDPGKSSQVFVFESQWDAFAVMDKLGWHRPRAIPGTAIIVTRGSGNGRLVSGMFTPKTTVYAFKQNDATKEAKNAADEWLANVCTFAGCKVLQVVTPARYEDVNDWSKAGASAAEIMTAIQKAIVVKSTVLAATQVGKRDHLQRAIDDPRPKIQLPGPDRLLSEFAGELAQVLREHEIFYRNGEILVLADGELKPISPQAFRSWAEKFFIGYRRKTFGDNSYEFDVTMSDNEARGTLAAPQFTDALRIVRCVNHARLPIIGPDGKMILLPNGYHPETQTLTLAEFEYSLDMSLEVAVKAIHGLLEEFWFADGERSKAVAVSAMVGLYANQLLPKGSLRPCFIFVANAEGAGKSTLAKLCIAPTLGAFPTGCKSSEEDEIRKFLATAIREGSLVIFFDNLKGKLSSQALEAFLSAPKWSDRKLGVNETIAGENLATCFVTSNGVVVSPDMRRRSLFVELHLEAERAEDKHFKRVLELPEILELRPDMLAAFWAMLRHWDAMGRPKPSRGHSAFPHWSELIGGVVEAAGFACPLQTAGVVEVTDPDGEDMRKLVIQMAKELSPCTFSRLTELARELGLFENTIGPDGEELGRREKSAFAKLLVRYDRRLVLNYRFIVEGKGKTRRYKVEIGNGGNGGNGISAGKTSLCEGELGRADHADHSDHSNIAPE